MFDPQVKPDDHEDPTQEIGRVNNSDPYEVEHVPEVGLVNNEKPGKKVNQPEIGRVINQDPREVDHQEEIGTVNNEKVD